LYLVHMLCNMQQQSKTFKKNSCNVLQRLNLNLSIVSLAQCGR
jgi:hypothetical protein